MSETTPLDLTPLKDLLVMNSKGTMPWCESWLTGIYYDTAVELIARYEQLREENERLKQSTGGWCTISPSDQPPPTRPDVTWIKTDADGKILGALRYNEASSQWEGTEIKR